MIFLCTPAVVLFFILGGQINKLFRPIGVTLSIISMYLLVTKNAPLFCLPTLIYGVILSLGYGEHSQLKKWLKEEQKVRIVYGLLLALPVIITASLVPNWLALSCVPFIVASNCCRAGKIATIGKFEILWADVLRGLAVGLGMSWALLGV